MTYLSLTLTLSNSLSHSLTLSHTHTLSLSPIVLSFRVLLSSLNSFWLMYLHISCSPHT